MKKAVIISCFFDEINTSRSYLAYKFFKENYETKVLYSAFNHSEKRYKIFKNKDFISIRALKYKKNISLLRVLSHIIFSFSLRNALEREKPDIIYVNIPPNITGYKAIRYAQKKGQKILIDVVDLWPETFCSYMPLKVIYNLLVKKIWSYFREYSLRNASCIICESDYFKDKLGENYDVNVVNLAKSDDGTGSIILKKTADTSVTIGYLGSISHIYDFKSLIGICSILQVKYKKKVMVKIVGRGEKLAELESSLKENMIPFKYYGAIYDEKKKKSIIGSCDWGFNGYKKKTEVALSYKSIDYFSLGVPIINSAKGDTFKLVKRYGIGINYDDDLEKTAQQLANIKAEDINNLKFNVIKLFKDKFTLDKYNNCMQKIIEQNNL